MCRRVDELLLDDGSSPFAVWFGSLDPVPAAKVRVAVSRMEQGNLSRIEWFRDFEQALALWEDFKRRKTGIRRGR